MNNNEIKIDEKFKEYAKTKQKKQLYIGIGAIVLFLFLATFFTPRSNESLSLYTVLFATIELIIFAISLLYGATAIMSLRDTENYSYLRVSDLIICCIQIFRVAIVFGFIGLGIWLLTKVRGTREILFGLILIVLLANALLFFVSEDTFFRKIYFKIVKIFNLDDSDYDKNLNGEVTVAYYPYEKRYIYCKSNSNGEITNYSANSFDSFRHGFSSEFIFLVLLNKEISNLSKEYKNLKKEISCSKLKKTLSYKLDENNNFKYINVYSCEYHNFNNLLSEDTKCNCKNCKVKNKTN